MVDLKAILTPTAPWPVHRRWQHQRAIYPARAEDSLSRLSDVMGGVSAQGLAEPRFGAKVNGSREDESWKRFTDEALEKFLKNEYAGAYQQARLAEFSANLGL